MSAHSEGGGESEIESQIREVEGRGGAGGCRFISLSLW
jgi:hypothetical protein